MNAPKHEYEGRLEKDYGDPPGYVHESDPTKVKGDDTTLVVGSDANSDYVTSTTSVNTLPKTIARKAISQCRISLVPFAGSDNDYVG